MTYNYDKFCECSVDLDINDLITTFADEMYQEEHNVCKWSYLKDYLLKIHGQSLKEVLEVSTFSTKH